MNSIFAVFGLGATELIVILAVIVFLFGAKKLPGLARGLGQSIKEFKRGTQEESEENGGPKPKQPAEKK